MGPLDEGRSGDDEAGIHGQIARLAREVHESITGRMSPEQVLQEITTAAVSLFPAVDHAAVTLVRRKHRQRRAELDSTAATGPLPRRLDELQHEHGEGPCFDAIWEHETVLIDDVDDEDRWPKCMAAVREQTPIRSSLSIQLFTAAEELGALNLYAETPHAFDDRRTEDLATNLATHAAIALSSARRGEQFNSALASRDLIGQAKGIIMERFDTDSYRAFDMLRRLSQETNTPVADIAAKLTDKDSPVSP